MAHPVVVVDDESDLLDVLRDCLEEEGFAVFGMPDSENLIGLPLGTMPDLFVLDLMLPGRTGFELARHLRRTGFADTPMIAMSASPEVLQDAARSGLFQETIGKPFDLQELIDAMHGLLD